jgi:hypothetical protein
VQSVELSTTVDAGRQENIVGLADYTRGPPLRVWPAKPYFLVHDDLRPAARLTASRSQSKTRVIETLFFIKLDSLSGEMMDLTRLGDKNYTVEIAAASAKRDADTSNITERTAYLESLLPVIAEQIRKTSSWQMPQDITINESVAICLVLGIKDAFKNPVAQFLSVQPWQQAWMLKKWQMEKCNGQRIGLID